MTDVKKCPQCGAELPADAPAGICPKCLLAVGMVSDTAVRGESSDGAPTTPLPGSTRFVPPAPAALAHLFPQLEILEMIGVGGMGAVYKARQPGLDRLVAIKILPPEVGADPAFAQRFTREAQALARLGHQHIVPVYDFGVAQGLYYFIMEYVDGANLRHLIKTGEMKPAEALAIVPQICEALQFAHEEGIVHRDIKPENILIDKRGRVKIADFGLARLLGASAPEVSLTGTHQVLGTLHYMAPEQIQGLRTVDHRADIFSLGVVFYELLTGELPMGHFDPPSKKVAIDVRLDEVVLRALAREPERRYQHANDVKTDIDSIASATGVAQLAEPANSISPFWTPTWQIYAAFAFTFAMLLYPVFQAVMGKTFALGRTSLLASGAGLLASSFLAYLIERCQFNVLKPWSDRGNVVAMVSGIVMMMVPYVILNPRDLAAWLPAEYVQFSDREERWLRCLALGLSLWTIYFASTRIWLLLGRSIRENRQRDGLATLRPENTPQLNSQQPPLGQLRHDEIALGAEQEAEERQRSAELAEIAPDWLAYVMMGLFGLGWILIGLMWNFRHAAVAIAIFAMFATFIWIVQWKLAYLPKLRLEIGRQPHWKRLMNGTLVALVFFAGMLCVIAGQVSLADLMTDPSSLVPTSFAGTDAEAAAKSALRLAHLKGLGDESAKLWMRGGLIDTSSWSNVVLSWFAGALLLFAAVSGMIHTRRYRYTWKHWWAPSLSVVIWLLASLMIVHFIHLSIVGYQSGSRKVREIRCAASRDAVETGIDRWAAEKDYLTNEYRDWGIKKDGANVGQIHASHLVPRSWFDRYRASWSYMFLRPKPPLYITTVTRDAPADAYVRIEFPYFAENSPEEEMWRTLLDGLEEQIGAAAKEKAKTRDSTDTPDGPKK